MKAITKSISVGLAVVLACCSSWASAEEDYWGRAQKLMIGAENAKTPEDRAAYNEAWIRHLKSLTKEQLLTMLRQYSKEVEKREPAEREWAPVISMRILAFYAEPLKRSDLTEVEFQEMRRSEQRSLEAGLIPARFNNESFEELIGGIADRREGAYFRYTLIDVLRTKDFYPILSTTQMGQLLNTCLMVLSDRESPTMVREKCLEALSYIFQRECLRILYADDVVKEMQCANADLHVSSLVHSGEVKLTANTMEHLAPFKQKIQELRERLTTLLEDSREPESLKKAAGKHLNRLDRLPFPCWGEMEKSE